MSAAVLTLNMRFIPPPYIYLFLSDTEKINRCTSIGVGVEDQSGYASLSHVILFEGQLPTTVCLRLHFSVTKPSGKIQTQVFIAMFGPSSTETKRSK